MLRRLRNDDGQPAGPVRLLAALLILALALGVAVTAASLLLPLLRWALPALF
jgi:hypothetical protein